jgi:hypothetical protein
MHSINGDRGPVEFFAAEIRNAVSELDLKIGHVGPVGKRDYKKRRRRNVLCK